MSFSSRDDHVLVSSPGSIQQAPSSRFEPHLACVTIRAIRTRVTACSAGIASTESSGITIGLGRSFTGVLLVVASADDRTRPSGARCDGQVAPGVTAKWRPV
jgi:hypothetical protein